MNVSQELPYYPMQPVEFALQTSGLSQALLVAVILISFSTNVRDPRFLLGIFMALYGMTFFGDLGLVTGFLFAVPWLIIPVLFVPLFLGPVIFFYICALVDGENSINLSRAMQHGIAPLASTGVALGLLFVPGDTLRAILRGDFEPQSVMDLAVALDIVLVAALTAMITLVYLIRGYIKLYAHGSRIRSEFSNLERKRLGWLRFSLINLGLFWAVSMIADGTGFTDSEYGSIVLNAWELMIFYVMAVLGVRQRVIFNAPSTPSSPEERGGPEDENASLDEGAPGGLMARPQKPLSKYAKSGLTENDMARISEKIRHAVEGERLYENCDLSLTDLAGRIGVQPPYVSQTLTQQIGANFYDFIAQARIRAAMKLLAEPDNNDSILTIAVGVGFNSKSTFNAAFKRVCGVTPSEWRRNARTSATAAAGG